MLDEVMPTADGFTHPATRLRLTPPLLLKRVFSFPVALAAALMSSLFLLAVSKENGYGLPDPDIWWHLRDAQYLIAGHHFFRQDLFSFTVAGKPWINFEWLSELPFYFAFQELGARGLFLVMMALTEAILLGVFLLAYIRSRDVKAAFLATWVAVLLTTVSLGPRTLLVGWLLLVVELLLMELYRAGRDWLWAMPALFCVWINAHGSWFVGLVLWIGFVATGFIAGEWGAVQAVAWTTKQRRKLLLVTGASLVALFANPYGWRLVAYPFQFALQQADNIRFIQEWASLDFHTLRGKIILATLLGMGLLNLLRPRPWRSSEVFFALVAVYGGLSYSRFTFLAAILLAPMLAVDLRGVLGPYLAERDGIGRNAVLLAVLLLIAMWRMPAAGALQDGMESTFPRQALARVNALPPDARLFNAYEWGGYLLWNLPGRAVFIDSRADVFVKEGVFAEYVQTVDGWNSLATLDKYRIDFVLLPRVNALSYLLAHTSAWTVDWQDSDAVLFRRNGALPERVIAKAIK